VRRRLAALAICGVLASLIPAALAGPSLIRYERREAHMGTRVLIIVYAADAAAAERAMQAGFDRITMLDRALSDYRDDSELMRLAARAGQGEMAIGDDLFSVLQSAQTVAERSDGAFDVTQGALTRLWRSARKLSELPRSERVEQARANGGYRFLHLDARTRTARLDRPGIGLDVGGIAKGFAADEALSAIAAQDVTRALVGLGGDIAVSDAPPGEPGWHVAIAPLVPAREAHEQTLMLRHAAISTAGDAEQWFEVDGQRYSHLIDPRSGWPMQGRSATTVIARRGIDADGLDTAAALLGPEAGARLVESVPGAAMRMERQRPEGGATEVRTSAGWPQRAPLVYNGERQRHSNATAVAELRPIETNVPARAPTRSSRVP
jgi:thiamine biosynthesis lipoprotein